ncbi:uncharacterized protein LTR77_003372 [Saxophila tyrrhenica]|uniref:FAD-binding domain-containing protein n=1 Tax=Saxophila tyrrhenica TaxID=1690608 RepID=A0AAV9PGW1_9PEZI|nr:hypothetical protein LTR77_003372 [Saxophila tyrrhenica]
MGSLSDTKLNVTIIGAGIAGLATAVALAQKNHNVTVLESKPALNEFGASIGITANGVRPLKAWGLTSAFSKVVTKNGFLDFRDGLTGELLGHLPHNKNSAAVIGYGEEIWNINRRDLQDVLAAAAEEAGARLVFGKEFERIDLETGSVVLKGGETVEGDVVVGADGIASGVRREIPALKGVEAIPRGSGCYRCTVPKEKMRGNAKLEWLLESGDEYGFLGPGRYLLSWPLPPHRAYDVVLGPVPDAEVPPGRWGMKGDPEVARADFADFCPTVVELLEHIDTCVKWRIAELPPLETCRSESGRVVIIGDAYHAMLPHAASGGNSALEDAACLAKCLDWAARTSRPVSSATEAFQAVRQPRLHRMQIACHDAVELLDGKEDFIPVRKQMLAAATKAYDADLALSEAERRARPKEDADMQAKFPTEPYLQWLYGYDAIAIARGHLAKL